MKKIMTKKTIGYFLFFDLLIAMIVSFSILAAHHLDNKFFPADSPILADSYPNDFLPVGVLIFMFLGMVTAGFLYDSLLDKQLEGIGSLVVLFVFVLITLPSFIGRQIQYQETWVEYIGELALPWANAWLVGGSGVLILQRNFGPAKNKK